MRLTRRSWIPAAALVLAGSVLPAQNASAATIISEGHVDVAVHYDAGSWEFHVHDEDNGIEYHSDEAILLAKWESIIPRPSGAQYDFLGVPAGADVWVLPQFQNPNLLFLGVSNEASPTQFSTWNPGDPRIPAGAFRWLEWELISVSGPGDFAVYSEGGSGVTVWMSTFSNPNPNTFYQLIGSHSHVNWAFTKAGDYEVTFRVKARLANGDFTISDPGTFLFHAQRRPSSVVPEPSSFALAGIGLALFGLAASRRIRPQRA